MGLEERENRWEDAGAKKRRDKEGTGAEDKERDRAGSARRVLQIGNVREKVNCLFSTCP